MLSKLFLGLSLLGAEWVLYLLIGLSILSVTLIIERIRFYRLSSVDLADFREKVRTAIARGDWQEARQLATSASAEARTDLERPLVRSVLDEFARSHGGTDVLNQIAQDSVVRSRIHWDRNLAILATIGSNAPFVGLFGTVLGIIQAFHDLSRQAGGAAQTVTSGISEALVATAVGILVAIPATVAFNLFQRRVRTALAEAEGLKSFLVARLISSQGQGDRAQSGNKA